MPVGVAAQCRAQPLDTTVGTASGTALGQSVAPTVDVVRPVAPFMPLRRLVPVGPRPSGTRPAWMPVRAGRPRISLAVQAADEELEGALGMWRDLVSDFGDDSKLFRQIAEAETAVSSGSATASQQWYCHRYQRE